MQLIRSSVDTMKGPADWFTGDVYVDAVAGPAGTSTFAAALVHFTPSARAAWHTHPHGQTIFVTEGVARRSPARREFDDWVLRACDACLLAEPLQSPAGAAWRHQVALAFVQGDCVLQRGRCLVAVAGALEDCGQADQ